MRRTLWLLPLLAGCAGPDALLRAPSLALDAVLIPGCPTDPGGRLSLCQRRRAAWAALLWERGHARYLIPSGAAVHSPYVEAETLARALVALGVPEERVLREPQALHTDENMAYSLRVARRAGLHTLGVASDGPHARGGCGMLEDWGHPCVPLPIGYAAAEARLAQARGALDQLRLPPVPAGDFVPLARRERRLPSFLLYPYMALRGWLGVPLYSKVRPAEALTGL